MKEEIVLPQNVDSEILKIVSLNKDKYELYFDFLSIPVEVNKAYLHTIIKDLDDNNHMKVLA